MKKYLVVMLVVLLLVPTAGLAQVSTEEITGALCVEINLARATGGVKTLPNARFLDAAAERFARAQAEKDKMGHASTEDLRALLVHSYTVGENVGFYSGPSDARKIAATLVDAWKKSPRHHDNLMREDDTAIGVGVAYGASGRVYVSYLTGKVFADAHERPSVEKSVPEVMRGAMPDLPYSEVPGDDPIAMRAITGSGFIVCGRNRDLNGAVRVEVVPLAGKNYKNDLYIVDAEGNRVRSEGTVRVYMKLPKHVKRPVIVRTEGQEIHFAEVAGTDYIWFPNEF